ncbi:universal stress protein [Nocardioides sp. NPDC057772]|uniref:universal stress protein n=1 Tax=Nocardioides sp. NPDC057772 TaxID=3346245 RepID=UPI00366AD494
MAEVIKETRNLVLAGVDGTEAGIAAARYAAAEAVRSNSALHLVYVVDPYAPPLPTWPPAHTDPDSRMGKLGRAILAEAEEAVASSGAVVSTYLLLGSPASVLAQEAARARLLVLGDQPRTRFDRIITSSIIGPVAAHSPVPVVVVPSAWPRNGSPREIVVGVHDAATSVALVRRGLEVAAAHGAALRLLHAWHTFGAYQDYLTVGSEEKAWTARAEQEVGAALEAARAECGPEAAAVDVRVEVVHAQTAYALVQASRRAELLILGRSRHFLGFGHLGGTARAVLRESSCPVEIDPYVAPAFEGDAGTTGELTADDEPAGAGRRS